MEFYFVVLLLTLFMTIGLSVKRYTPRVRLMLMLASALGPAWFFVLWLGST